MYQAVWFSSEYEHTSGYSKPTSNWNPNNMHKTHYSAISPFFILQGLTRKYSMLPFRLPTDLKNLKLQLGHSKNNKLSPSSYSNCGKFYSLLMSSAPTNFYQKDCNNHPPEFNHSLFHKVSLSLQLFQGRLEMSHFLLPHAYKL